MYGSMGIINNNINNFPICKNNYTIEGLFMIIIIKTWAQS